MKEAIVTALRKRFFGDITVNERLDARSRLQIYAVENGKLAKRKRRSENFCAGK